MEASLFRRLGTIALLVIVAFFPIFTGRFYAIGDMRDVYIPLELFFQQELKAGRLPAWHPNVAWGFPVIASGQIGFFYPPLLLGRLIAPIWLYLPLILIGHVVAMGMGMFLFLRDRKLSVAAAYIGALAFALSAFAWQHLYHLNIILAIAWFPWQMLAVTYVARQQRISRRSVALLTLLFGLPFLIGQLQIPFLTTAVASIYFMYLRWRAYRNTKELQKSAGIVLVIALLSFFIASAQLLPTLELLQYSSRSSAAGFDLVRANQHSYPLYHLPTLLFPRFYGSDDTYWGKRLEVEYGFYIGVIPLLLAFWVLCKKSIFNTQDASFFKGLLIVSFLFALGDLSPFRLIGLEPSLWVFSAPARWLFFTTFSLSMLAAYGWDVVTERGGRASFYRFATATALLTASGVLLANILLHAVDVTDWFSFSNPVSNAKVASMFESAQATSVSLLSPLTALPLVSLLSLPLLIHRRYGQQVIILLATFELLVFAATAMPTILWQQVLTPPTTISKLPEAVQAGQARMYSIREGGDTGAYFTNPQSRADDTMREQQRQLLVPLIHAQFGIPGVEWPASLDLQKQEEVLQQLREKESYELADRNLARQLNIGAVVLEQSGDVFVEELTFAPRTELIDTEGTATYRAISPGRIRIETEAAEAGALLVRDTYLPGWQAHIDDRPVEIMQHEPFFRSLAIPAGSQIVELVYKPQWIYIGLLLSLMTAASCIIVLTGKAAV